MTKRLFLLTLLAMFIIVFGWRLVNLSAREKIVSKTGYKAFVERVGEPKNLLAKTIDLIFPEPNATLLNGILFGIKGEVKSDLYQSFQKAGMLHVVALSGQNISILLAVISKITLVFGRRASTFLSICGIVAFIVFVGPSASVVRAGLMGVLMLLATVFGRQYLSLWGLLFSGVVMMGVSPSIISDLGFQLSFLATLGIILFSQSVGVAANRKTEHKSGIIYQVFKVMRESLLISLSAQVFTTPIIVANFGQFSTVSLVTNLLTLWTVPIIMGLGAIASFLGLLFLPLGMVVGFSANLFLSYFVAVVSFMSSLPYASVQFTAFKIWMGFLYFGVVFVFLAFRRRRAG